MGAISKWFSGVFSGTPEPEEPIPSPPSDSPQHEWSRKIRSYGRRVARELAQANVTQWPGENFWVIAADVHEAMWYAPHDNIWAKSRGLLRDGSCEGTALLLFTDGTLVNAEFFGFFDFDEKFLKFSVKDTDIDSWSSRRWANENTGSWREGYGNYGREPHARRQESFKGWWPHSKQEPPPGLGTSLALKTFLTTHSTALPRHY